jgi:hypothetical protein
MNTSWQIFELHSTSSLSFAADNTALNLLLLQCRENTLQVILLTRNLVSITRGWTVRDRQIALCSQLPARLT